MVLLNFFNFEYHFSLERDFYYSKIDVGLNFVKFLFTGNFLFVLPNISKGFMMVEKT